MASGAQTLLIVDDDPQLRALYARAASRWGYQVVTAATAEEAIQLLANAPRFVLLDVHLPDGSGIRVAEHASQLRPAPMIIAITGRATRQQSFRLAELGVRRLLEKPFELSELRLALRSAIVEPPNVVHHILPCVGNTSLPDLQGAIRSSMLDQALALTDGNTTAAARLLGVTRQAIQKARRRSARSEKKNR